MAQGGTGRGGDEPPARPPRRGALARAWTALSPGTSTPWLRAPVLLLWFPGLLVAIAAAGLVLAVASAAAPLFVSSAGNATVQNGLATQLCPYTTALQVNAFAPMFGAASSAVLNTPPEGSPRAQLAQKQRILDRATAGLPGIRGQERTIVGPIPAILGPHHRTDAVALLARDGQLRHVRVLSRAGGEGVWLTDTTARRLGVRAGQAVTLRNNDGGRVASAKVRVAGVYRDLARLPPASFWCSVSGLIYPNNAFGTFVPPPVALLDRRTMLNLGERLRVRDAQFTWEFLLKRSLTLPQVQFLGNAVNDLESNLRTQDSASGFAIFNFPEVQSELPALAEQSAETTGTVQGPVDAISLAGRIVALLVIAAAGVYWVDRRRIEVGLLNARGVGPGALATKVLLETALPLAGAAAGGLALATWLVRRLGPARLIDPAATSSALWQVAVTVALAWVLLGVVAAVASRGVAQSTSGVPRSGLARAPWELAVLALGAASLYEITTRGSASLTSATPGSAPKLDALLLLFPILFLAGTAGLAARLLRRLLPRLRGAGSRRRPAVYLASRRLAGAPGIALALVTATALSIGILAYAATLSASARASARAKALVFTGSDVKAVVGKDVRIPSTFPYPVTRVVNVATATLLPGVGAVDAIGVDARSFGRVAFWDRSFSDRPLATLLAALAPRDAHDLPILVAGATVSRRPTLGLLGGTNVLLPARVAVVVRAFPGMEQGRSLVAVDQRVLARYPSLNATVTLLIKGPPAGVVAALRRAHVKTENVVTAQQVSTATPVFLSLSWIFQFLQALGVLTGLIALGGTVLYLEARQRSREVSYALARRMGLSRMSHRLSVLLELGGMLLTGLLLALGLSWVAAKLVYGKLDPQPNLPPPALFRSPLSLFAVTALSLAVVAAAGAWLVQRAADRAKVSEVLRVAG